MIWHGACGMPSRVGFIQDLLYPSGLCQVSPLPLPQGRHLTAWRTVLAAEETRGSSSSSADDTAEEASESSDADSEDDSPAASQDEPLLRVGTGASAPVADGVQQPVSSDATSGAGAATAPPGAAAGSGSGGEDAEDKGLKVVEGQPQLVSPPGHVSPASRPQPAPVLVASKCTFLPSDWDAGRSLGGEVRGGHNGGSRGGRGNSRACNNRAGEEGFQMC